ncbi:MAG: lysophospholipid acyltransferase family protein [bacterium]
MFRVNIIGTFPRKHGPLIVVSNHISFIDPPLIGYLTCRLSGSKNVYILAKRELFNIHKLYGKFLTAIHAIPLNRAGMDINAIKRSFNVLDNKGKLIIFPEGTRNKTGKLMKGKPGAGYIALKGGVNILPVFIHNADEPMWKIILGLRQLTVVMGDLIDISRIRVNSRNARKVAQIMMNEIGDLKQYV